MNEIEKVVEVQVIDTKKNDETSDETEGKGELSEKMKEKVVQVEVSDTNENEDEMSDETDGKGELRVKMKELRKILKTARKQLCGNRDEDLHDMYKSYKHCA